jgi:hypothetical protein
MSEARTIDLGDSRKYRTEIPNLVFTLGLSPFELALYVHLKKTAGAEGACWKSTQTLSEETGMSAGMVSKAKDGLEESRKALGGKALINVSEEPNRGGGRPRHVITITDIWPENFAANARPSSPHEVASSSGEVASSPHELKKEPREERTLEEVGARGRAASTTPEGDPLSHPAVLMYQREMKPDKALSIHQCEQIAAKVSNLEVWGRVLTVFAGNGHRGRDGTGRYVGNALDRYQNELARGSPPGAKPLPVAVETKEEKTVRLEREYRERQQRARVHA